MAIGLIVAIGIVEILLGIESSGANIWLGRSIWNVWEYLISTSCRSTDCQKLASWEVVASILN